MKKRIILIISLLILIVNLAILPVNAATEDVSAVNENSKIEDIYINSNLTTEETVNILSTLEYNRQQLNVGGGAFYDVGAYLCFSLSSTDETIKLGVVAAEIIAPDLPDDPDYLIGLAVKTTQDELLYMFDYSNEGWESIKSVTSSLLTEVESGIYQLVASSEESFLSNDLFTFSFQGLNFELLPYTQNEKLKSIIYDITPPPPPPTPPTIFELIYSFIYDTILGGESELFDTSQLAVLLTLFVIILIILAIISIIRGVFNWFRWRR